MHAVFLLITGLYVILAGEDLEPEHFTVETIAGTPVCRPFSCPAGEAVVPREDYQPFSHGCNRPVTPYGDSPNFVNSAPPGVQEKYTMAVDQCCIARDVCLRSCGMSSEHCFEDYRQCVRKRCGQEVVFCRFPAVEYGKLPGVNDKQKCKNFEIAQRKACECVSLADHQAFLNERLVEFYQKNKADKLNATGGVSGTDQIWKKWKGKELEMFATLTLKYRAMIRLGQGEEPPPEKLEVRAKRRTRQLWKVNEKMKAAMDAGDHGKAVELKQKRDKGHSTLLELIQTEQQKQAQAENFQDAKKFKQIFDAYRNMFDDAATKDEL